MNKDNIILSKSKDFALKIVKIYFNLKEEKKEYVLSKQLLKSGTSIGANVREANVAMSNAEFISKMNIALKEAGETEYWLELLFQSDLLKKESFDNIYQDCNEINRLLTSIIKSSKK
jgi:four helix bundle protein